MQNFYGLNLYLLCGILLILISGYLFSLAQSVVISLLIGLGSILNCSVISYIAFFALIGLTCSFLKSKYGVYEIIGVLVVQAFLGYYFNCLPFFEGYITILQSAIVGGIYLCLPKKWLKKIKCYTFNEKNYFSYTGYVNHNRELTKQRLYKISNTFFALFNVVQKAISFSLPISDVKKSIVKRVKQKLCIGCKNGELCAKNFECEIEKLVNLVFEKGNITILDATPFMSNNCFKTAQIVLLINNFFQDYIKNEKNIYKEKETNLIVADEFYNFSIILKNLARSYENFIVNNREKEESVIKILNQNNIDCAQINVFLNNNSLSISMLVKSNHDVNVICEILETYLNLNLIIVKNYLSEISGWRTVIVEEDSRYKVISSCAYCCKNGNDVSGDSFLVTRISKDKFLIALSDGMGHGEKAKKSSELIINMIENFYKAGFENSIILNSINSLLSVCFVNDFSTLDLCILDLNQGFTDFVKLGASSSYIKEKNYTTKISGSSLPFGVLEKVKTSTFKTAINEGDYIIVCSDGLVDAFGDENLLYTYINHLPQNSPKEMANQILKKAKEMAKGYLKDDVTVIVSYFLRNKM